MAERNRHQPSTAPFEDPLGNYEPTAYADELERSLCEDRVASIRATPVATVAPDTPIIQVMQKMDQLDVACVLISEDDRLVGIFTERDVLNKVADRFDQIKDRPVREVMTPDPLAVYETDNAATALGAIASTGLRHIPVLDVNDHIVGVVSPQRVTLFLQQHFRPPEPMS